MYGPTGAGKKTRIMGLLRELYGNSVTKIRMEHKTFQVNNPASTNTRGISTNVATGIEQQQSGIDDDCQQLSY